MAVINICLTCFTVFLTTARGQEDLSQVREVCGGV